MDVKPPTDMPINDGISRPLPFNEPCPSYKPEVRVSDLPERIAHGAANIGQ